MKVTFKLQVKVKRCDTVFADEMDPGVLAEQLVTFDLPEGYSHAMLSMSLDQYGRELMNDAVEVVITGVEQ